MVRVDDPWRRTGYGSFMPALVDALGMTRGAVLELGAGYWSTPFLHQMCRARGLVTVEANAAWFRRFASLAAGHHELVRQVRPMDRARGWGVVLVDNGAAERAPALEVLRADVFVVHDTELEHTNLYLGLAEALEGFRWRRDYATRPQTTLVSRTLQL